MISPDGANHPLIHGRSVSPPLDQTPHNGPLPINGALMPNGYAVLSSAVAAATPASPTLSTLLMALKRRWLLATILSTMACALAVSAVYYLFPPKFVAQARLELAARPPRPVLIRELFDTEVDPTVFRA